ncbi:hypothetical protein KXS07_32400 [Inquilinus limosus]|uniref:hypothetical protein n=1 Tax=Inquilinus limosus TaxID=171674 RepID=UPI003F14DA2C
MTIFFVLAGFLLALTLSGPSGRAADMPSPSGTVVIDQMQLAFLVSGSLGGGRITFQGQAYRFSIAGLGAGGKGVFDLQAEGEVYNLTAIDDFAGLYDTAGLGHASGKDGKGRLWLQNADDVVLQLRARYEGLVVTGVDDVDIQLISDPLRPMETMR